MNANSRVPWWALVSAALAPVVLIGGWTLAASLQPPTYSPARDTISDLAGRGANDRWLMTAALVGLGTCHLVTAAGLHSLRPPGRVLLALGGAATLAVAGLPEPAHGASTAHSVAASVSFLALTLWPILATADVISVAATLVLASLLVWFGVALATGSLVGLSERVVAGTQAGWVLVATFLVATCLARRRRHGAEQ